MLKVYTRKKRIDHMGAGASLRDQYWELTYKQYDNKGNLCATGIEDFSGERMSALRTYLVRVPSERKNKNGGMMTEAVCFIMVAKGVNATAAARCVTGNFDAIIEK